MDEVFVSLTKHTEKGNAPDAVYGSFRRIDFFVCINCLKCYIVQATAMLVNMYLACLLLDSFRTLW